MRLSLESLPPAPFERPRTLLSWRSWVSLEPHTTLPVRHALVGADRVSLTFADVPTLWHASEDPHIEIFRPHRARTAQVDEPLVWAIDDEHVPAYWFPRDCPRATFWVTERTSKEDRAWMHGAARVHAIEWEWWERFRDATLACTST